MKTLLKATLLGLVCTAGAQAQTLEITNLDGCSADLAGGQPVTFREDGGIDVVTTATLPEACVSRVIGGGAPASVQAQETGGGALVNEADEETTFEVAYSAPDDFSCELFRNSTRILTNPQVQRPSGVVSGETIASTSTYRIDCSLPTAQGTATTEATARVTFTGSGGGDPIDPGTACSTVPSGTRAATVAFNRGIGEPEITGATVEDLFYPPVGPDCDPATQDCDPDWPVAEDIAQRTFRISLRRNTYVSLPFVIPADTPSIETLTLSWEQSTSPSDGTVISVSDCVGGLFQSEAVPQPQLGGRCWVRGTLAGGGLRIGTDERAAQCVLQPGVTYYLNFMDLNPDTDTTTCSSANCTLLLQPF